MKNAADKGSLQASYILGQRYRSEARTTSSKEAQALQYFQKAAEQGHADAQFQVARILRIQMQNDEIRGLKIKASTQQTALDYLKSAAEQNHVEALSLLGDLYLHGSVYCKAKALTVEKNELLANKYFQQAAELGHSPSQKYLAFRQSN